MKFLQRQPGDTDWTYPFDSITKIQFVIKNGKERKTVELELQSVSNQPTWNDGTLSGLNTAHDDVQAWIGSDPLPGNFLFAATGSSFFDNILLSYIEDSGPSAASVLFNIQGGSLVPDADDITITPSSNLEIYNGSSWGSAPIVIPYTGGAIITATIYKIRLKAGLDNLDSPFSETLTVSGGGVDDYVAIVTGTVSVGSPMINITESLLAFGDLVKNGLSASQSFDISGDDLVDDIVITAPSGYIINLDDSTDDDGPITLVPDINGSVPATTIYILFSPVTVQGYSGNVACTSTGAITQNVAVTGNCPAPSLSVSNNSFSFGNIVKDGESASQTYNLSGTFCYANIVVTAPSGWIINLDDSDNDDGPITLIPDADGTLSSTPVYAIFKPTVIQLYSNHINNTSTGASTKNVMVSGNCPTPVINITPSSLSFGSLAPNVISTPQSYSIDVEFCYSNVIITAPSAEYYLNLDGSNNDDGPITLVPDADGSISSTPIYVLFAPTTSGSFSGNVTNASTGATTQNIAVDGDCIEFVVASGGTVTTSGDYKIHTFTSSGNFVVSGLATNSADNDAPWELQAAGGGGGGSSGAGGAGGGGGGAGGKLSGTKTLTVTTYAIVIGAKGSGGGNGARGGAGNNATFDGNTAVGGGGGGGYPTGVNGANGGNGGGATYSGTGGTGTGGQGNNGGGNFGSAGAGGGGFSAAGHIAGGPGDGGAGYTSGIDGVQRGGGGGGGAQSPSTPGAGADGGGNGSNNSNGSNAQANTGGGGGGASYAGAFIGGNGSDSIFIITYKYQ